MENRKWIKEMKTKPYISVIGASKATAGQFDLAVKVGRAIAEAGCVMVCGGLGGVMEGAAKGVSEVGGLSVGILPDADREVGNPYLSVAIPTGLGHARNYLVAAAADGVIAVGGAAGTLSEIGLALKLHRYVVLLESFDLETAGLNDSRLYVAKSADEAVNSLMKMIK